MYISSNRNFSNKLAYGKICAILGFLLACNNTHSKMRDKK